MNYVVIDLAYGDSGKGTIVDSLVRRVDSNLVVRFSGGPQASHHVVLPDGRWHGFSQWGAGTFAGASTFLSQYMIVEPYAMHNEAEVLKAAGIVNPWSLLTVDPDCVVITPWQWRMNRLRELKRENRHGSCGMGVGETRQDDLNGLTLHVRDLGTDKGREILYQIRHVKALEVAQEWGPDELAYTVHYTIDAVHESHKAFRDKMQVTRLPLHKMDSVIYEGSQGILIDETLGFAPHNTWSDVTANNAVWLAGLGRNGIANTHVIGVVPAVWTRHGAGPFPSETRGYMLAYRGAGNHNRTNDWQGKLRYGYVDKLALEYVCRNTRVDSLAFTKLDQVSPIFPVCVSYDYANGTTDTTFPLLTDELANVSNYELDNYTDTQLAGRLGLPIAVRSSGCTYEDKKWTALLD